MVLSKVVVCLLSQAMPGRPMPGVRQQHQYRNNRGQQPPNRHPVNHVPYGGHMNTSQASQVKRLGYIYHKGLGCVQ